MNKIYCELCKEETLYKYKAELTRQKSDNISVHHKIEICHVCANKVFHYLEGLKYGNDYNRYMKNKILGLVIERLKKELME